MCCGYVAFSFVFLQHVFIFSIFSRCLNLKGMLIVWAQYHGYIPHKQLRRSSLAANHEGLIQTEWVAPRSAMCVCVQVRSCMVYVRLCSCVSHQTKSSGARDGPGVPRISHAHSHQAVSRITCSVLLPASLSCPLVLSFSFPNPCRHHGHYHPTLFSDDFQPDLIFGGG